jgi:hypothetical protein
LDVSINSATFLTPSPDFLGSAKAGLRR